MRSVLDIVAPLPSVNSFKRGQTIVDELAGRGLAIVSAGRTTGSETNDRGPMDRGPKTPPMNQQRLDAFETCRTEQAAKQSDVTSDSAD